MRILTLPLRLPPRSAMPLLLAGLTAAPPLLSPSPAAATTAQTSQLRVTVLQNGQPLPRWPVSVLVGDTTLSNAIPGEPVALTGPDGSVTLRGLQTGSGLVRVSPPWGGGPSATISQPVELQPGAVQAVTVSIETGRVTGIAALATIPVPGARLSLKANPTSSTYFQYADSRGRFTFDVPPGDYLAKLTFQDGSTPIWSGTVSVAAGETQTLYPTPDPVHTGLLFGTAYRNGAPLPGLTVTLTGNNGPNPLVRTRTGPRGEFLLPSPTGIVTVTLSNGQQPLNNVTPLLAGGLGGARTLTVKHSTRMRLDFDLSDRILSGTVTKNGQPLAGALVRVFNGLRDEITSPGYTEVQTDTLGHYRAAVVPNTYAALQVYTAAGQLVAQTVVDPLASTSARPINFDWKPRHLTGIVQLPDGQPVAGLPIGVAPNEEDARTSPDGTFSIDVSPSMARGGSLYSGPVLAWLYQKFVQSPGGDLTTRLVLKALPGRIEGQVRFPGPDPSTPGPPISGAYVTATISGFPVLPVITDHDGRFVLDPVPVGNTMVHVLAGSLPTEPSNTPTASRPVVVKPGQTSTVDLTVQAGRLDIAVQGDGGTLAPSFVTVKRLQNPPFDTSIAPDDTGAFRALLAPGTYLVRWEYSPGPEIGVTEDAPRVQWRVGQQVTVSVGHTSDVTLQARRLDPSWTADLRTDLGAGPAITGDIAVVGAEDGALTALQAREPGAGAILWSFPLGSPVRARPLAVGSRVFAATVDGRLHAIDIGAGPPVGEAPGFPVQIPDTAFFLPPVWDPNGGADPLDGQVILAGSGPSPTLARVDGRTGAVQSSVALPAAPASPPLPIGAAVAVGLDDTRTVALNPDGSLLWQRSFDQVVPGAFGAPALTRGGGLVEGTDAGILEALRSEDGGPAPAWPESQALPSFASYTFNGIRDRPISTADDSRLIAAGGDLGLIEVKTSNGRLVSDWPWPNRDPFQLEPSGDRPPLRYIDAPLDLVGTDGAERIYAPARVEAVRPLAPNVRGSTVSTENGVFLEIPLAHPGNGYSIFYGDSSDRFIGRPVATGNGPGDVVLAATESGRVYAFPVLDTVP